MATNASLCSAGVNGSISHLFATCNLKSPAQHEKQGDAEQPHEPPVTPKEAHQEREAD
jgi:hypothetical protein